TEPGGLLTRGIPDFRFAIASARAECALVLSLGVEFRGGTRIEGTHALRDLLAQGFDAVFVAIGASAASAPLFPGDGHAEVHDAMTLLLSPERSMPGRVVVVGDGDLAVDAARLLARGRRARGEPSAVPVALVLTSPIERSTAAPAMLGAAIRDGVALHDGWTPRGLCIEEGTVMGIELERADGRTVTVLPCDAVVTAAPRVPARAALGAPPLDGAGYVAVDPDTMHTTLPGVWAGGACVSGHRSIAHATADGKRAAWQIHSALTGQPVRSSLLSAWVEAADRAPTHTAPVPSPSARRAALPLMATPPLDPFSPSALLSLEEMQREAARCYDCAVTPSVDEGCTLCGVCVRDCPESAFTITPEPRELKLDQDKCTRCGICADRCPEAVITMVRAVWEERLTTARPRAPESAPLYEESDEDERALTPR
ncbi:MAG: FAD-dependent oxidoreductase, partial [Gemmatimonadaceae bacterium]